MEYIKLNENQRNELISKGSFFIDEDESRITFLSRGEVVGNTDLPNFSTGDVRLRIAEMINVKDFDDYILISKGVVRGKASDIKGFSLTDDIDSDYGSSEGRKYQRYLRRKTCEHYGRSEF